MFPRPNVPLFTSPFLPVSLSLALFSFFCQVCRSEKPFRHVISVSQRQLQINCNHKKYSIAQFQTDLKFHTRSNSVLSPIPLRESFFISLAERMIVFLRLGNVVYFECMLPPGPASPVLSLLLRQRPQISIFRPDMT